MRELLVTITLLSVQVSSDEFEAKKRLELPPEVDPNFWPVRGRRSYWGEVGTPNSGQLFGNYFLKNENPRMAAPAVHFARRDHPQSPLGTNLYNNRFATSTRQGFTWIPAYTADVGPVGSDNQDYEGIFPGIWGSRFCPKKKPVSVVFPYGGDSNLISGASGICPGFRCGGDPVARIRGRREDERWRRQQPLYVDEPRWIEIDYNHGVLEGSKESEDPFFVARGKKRLDDDRNFSDIRERRHLDDVIDSYNSDPFFITRGKRSLKNDDDDDDLQVPKIWNEQSRRNLWDNSGEDKEESRKVLESEKVKTTDSLKSILKNSSEDLKFPGTTTSTTTTKSFGNRLDLDNKRIARSPVGLKNVNDELESSAEGGNIKNWESYNLQKNDEFIPAKPDRYSRPRDKHSNLQSMLEEPFFISRGKKDDDEKYSEIYKTPSNNRDRTISPRILSNLLKIYANGRRFRTTDGLEFLQGVTEDDTDTSKHNGEETVNYGVIRIRKSKLDGTNNKPPRSRRGMIEELLDQKTDDPFYVARGKRFFYDTKPSISNYDNFQITKPNKYSLFSETTQTELLQKLSNFPKKPFTHIIPEDFHNAENHIQGDKNFWNMSNNNAIN